jgi:hypothetical protein
MDTIKMDLGEMRWGYWLYWSGSGEGQLEMSCEWDDAHTVPYNAGRLSSGCTTSGLSSSAQLHIVSQSVSPVPTGRKENFEHAVTTQQQHPELEKSKL